MDRAFADFAQRDDADLDLVEGALLIAREAYPGLDLGQYRAKLDKLAAEARRYLPASGKRPPAVEKFNEFLFGRLGFRGNNEDYYDPRNSYFNEVIDRRLGIPITLSILYCDLARRVGMAALGVGFPGRYLVKCPTGRGELLVDCFDGRLVDRAECQALLDSMYGGRLRLTDDMLRVADARATLARVLNNLKGVYLGRRDYPRAARFVELSERLLPGLPEHARDLGMILIQQERFGQALGYLEDYLRRAPGAPDAGAVRGHVQMTRKLLTHLN